MFVLISFLPLSLSPLPHLSSFLPPSLLSLPPHVSFLLLSGPLQPMAADVWTGFLFRMQFVGVQLEFLRSRETEVQGSMTQSLARFDIQESEFIFESRSNQCKTVDLKSNAVIGYDSRYEGEQILV